MIKDIRSPKAKQRDEWMESKVGKGCCEPSILSFKSDSKFLQNRIEHAWCDGWDAGVKHAEKLMEGK